MDEFVVPAEPEELWRDDSQLAFRAQDFVDLTQSSPEKVGEIAESELAGLRFATLGALLGPSLTSPRLAADVAFVLCDQDPLCVVEQQNFDQLCSLLAAFPLVDGPKRRQLIDSLCSSLACLNAWIDKLLAQPAEPETVRQHRSAFKAYLFFLSWVCTLAGRESREAAAAAQSAAAVSSQAGAGGGRGRKKKAAAVEAMGGWDWEAQHPKVLKAVATALNTDLWALFRPSQPEESLMLQVTRLVRRGSGLGGADGRQLGRLGGCLDAPAAGDSCSTVHAPACSSKACQAPIGRARPCSTRPHSAPPASPRRHCSHLHPTQAAAALELPACAKSQELAGQAAHVLVVAALKYNQLEGVSTALVDLLNKHEHTPAPVAELLRYSIAQYDDARLASGVALGGGGGSGQRWAVGGVAGACRCCLPVTAVQWALCGHGTGGLPLSWRWVVGGGQDTVELPVPLRQCCGRPTLPGRCCPLVSHCAQAAAVVGEIAAVDPAEYERQQTAAGEKAGVRSIAAFVEELAERLPRFTAAQAALLLPHLGGKAHSLRVGIVHAVGLLLHKALGDAVADAADAAGVAARLRSKQHLLDVLVERIRCAGV